MRRLAILAALAAILPAAAGAALPTCHLPGADAATCIHVDREGTAGQWVLRHIPDGAAIRDRTYPVADGGPVPGMDPSYRWLLGIRIEPPEIDSRLQVVAYPCPESTDLTAGTITATCTPQVRPAADLHTATENAAQDRIGQAMLLLGLRDPADQVRAIALLQAARRGQVLTEAQEAWLDGMGAAGVEFVDQVRAIQAEIDAWIDAHPGQMPALGPAVWPPLPSAGE